MMNPTDDNSVVIEREFDVPVDVIWQRWTDPDHFKAWYGPTGVTIPVANLDVLVGGTRLISMEMQSPTGAMQMWFTGTYLEVIHNQGFVYTEAMSDEHGQPLPASDHNPTGDQHAVTEVRVELEDLGGRTRMVMTHTGIPGDSPGATGWHMALDKLTALIACT